MVPTGHWKSAVESVADTLLPLQFRTGHSGCLEELSVHFDSWQALCQRPRNTVSTFLIIGEFSKQNGGDCIFPSGHCERPSKESGVGPNVFSSALNIVRINLEKY
jgi:hypothetical protein